MSLVYLDWPSGSASKRGAGVLDVIRITATTTVTRTNNLSKHTAFHMTVLCCNPKSINCLALQREEAEKSWQSKLGYEKDDLCKAGVKILRWGAWFPRTSSVWITWIGMTVRSMRTGYRLWASVFVLTAFAIVFLWFCYIFDVYICI